MLEVLSPNIDRAPLLAGPGVLRAALAYRAENKGAVRPYFSAKRQRSPRARPPDGLKTLQEGAAKLGCSIKTLNGHLASGALRYVITGHGTKRPRKMLTDADLDTFIENQTRKDSPACQSSATRARHTGGSTFSSTVVAFSAQPRPRPSGKRKP
jgi:hypothetical protein